MIKIYTTNWCPSCNAAKKLLDSIDIAYQEINIEKENFSRSQLEELTGGYTVPQIVINNQCIGGYDKLLYLHQNNKLQDILNAK
jgi:glutaredoxin 3